MYSTYELSPTLKEMEWQYCSQLKDRGHNQSMLNFGLFFIFAQICLIFGMQATN